MTLSGFDFVDAEVETLEKPKPRQSAAALAEVVQITSLLIDPEKPNAPELLSGNVQDFLARIISDDVSTLTQNDKDLILQNILRARGTVKPRKNSVDLPSIFGNLLEGMDSEAIGQRLEITAGYVYNVLSSTAQAIRERWGGKMDLATFLELEDPESEEGERRRRARIMGGEASARTSDAPEDWFVDPIGIDGLAMRKNHYGPGEEEPLEWQKDSLCAQTDPEAFFPEKGGSTRDAKKICSTCEVRSQCLEYALENDERFGIWGGLSERERRKLRKRA